MRLFTLGYMASGADEKLMQLIADPAFMLVDIRTSAFSRFRPAYRRDALVRRCGNQYLHVPQLGNVNYRDRDLPVVLADPSVGLPYVLCLLDSGYSVCLLCGCAHVQTCHRQVVSDLLLARCSEVSVVHL
ncbi:MAG: DUF488 domain-containing protein [Chloroflexi bacterium]|nr:MAG: DUF488 domain-containing protein [Chloroflexota bacterium]